MPVFKAVLKTWGKEAPDGSLVLISIQTGNQRRYISTGIKIKKRFWDAKNRRIRKSHPDEDILNRRIRKKIADGDDLLNKLDLAGKRITADVLKAGLNPTDPSHDFWTFADAWLQRRYDKGEINYWRRGRAVLRKFREYVGTPLPWHRFTVVTLYGFNDFMEAKKGNSRNTRIVGFNILKTIVNRAIMLGILEPNHNPFLRFRADESQKTVRVTLTREEIETLESLDLPDGSWEVLARDVYIMSFRLRGARFGDVITLNWDNVKDGRINFVMQKTGDPVSIPIKPPIQAILDRYSRSKNGPHIFPPLNKRRIRNKEQLVAAISSVNAITSTYLKKVAKIAGIDKPIHMHSARHSFALIALRSGVSHGIIQSGLKHKRGATTDLYLRELDPEVLDTAFDAVDL